MAGGGGLDQMDQTIAWRRLAQETFRMRWRQGGGVGGAALLEMAFDKAQRPGDGIQYIH